jgi:autotransporter-associated beta strand protein
MNYARTFFWLAVLLSAEGIHAQTWTGATNSAWATTTNWNGGTPAGSTTSNNVDIALFNNTAQTTVGLNFGDLGTPYYLGTLRMAAPSATRTFGSNSSTAGVLVLNGTGANNLVLDNQASGSSMTIQGTVPGGTGALSLRLSAADNTVNAVGTINISAVIGQGATASGITKVGGGTLTLSGGNTYTGGTRIDAGSLALGASNVLANSGTINVNGGTLALSTFSDTVGAVTLTSGNITGTTGVLTGTSYSVQSGTISAILSGTGGLTKTTNGTVTLTRGNTFSGATTINGGTLSVSIMSNGGGGSGVGASSNAATNLILNGGTLEYTGTSNITTDRLFSVGSSGGGIAVSSSGSLIFNGTGSIGFNSQTGSRTLTLGGTGTGSLAVGITDVTGGGLVAIDKRGTGTWTLSGNNTLTGGLSIFQGRIILGSANAIGSANPVAFFQDAGQTATLRLNRNSVTVTGLDAGSTGSAVVENAGTNAATLTVNTSGSSSFAGVLQDGGSNALALIKSGSGTLTLSGSNTYTGLTTVSGGTLLVNGSIASAATVNSGGTLGGGGTISGLVTVNSGGTLSPGDSTGTITVGGLDLRSGSATAIEINGTAAAGVDFDEIVLSAGATTFNLGGNLSLSGSYAPVDGASIVIIRRLGGTALNGTFGNTAAPIAFNGGFATVSYAGNQVTLNFSVVPVPEPSSVAAPAGAALAGAVLLRRLRRKAA